MAIKVVSENEIRSYHYEVSIFGKIVYFHFEDPINLEELKNFLINRMIEPVLTNDSVYFYKKSSYNRKSFLFEIKQSDLPNEIIEKIKAGDPKSIIEVNKFILESEDPQKSNIY